MIQHVTIENSPNFVKLIRWTLECLTKPYRPHRAAVVKGCFLNSGARQLHDLGFREKIHIQLFLQEKDLAEKSGRDPFLGKGDDDILLG